MINPIIHRVSHDFSPEISIPSPRIRSLRIIPPCLTWKIPSGPLVNEDEKSPFFHRFFVNPRLINPGKTAVELGRYQKKVSNHDEIGGIPPNCHKPWFSKIRGWHYIYKLPCSSIFAYWRVTSSDMFRWPWSDPGFSACGIWNLGSASAAVISSGEIWPSPGDVQSAPTVQTKEVENPRGNRSKMIFKSMGISGS